MKPAEKWQGWLFVGILASIAFCVNAYFSTLRRREVTYYQPPQTQPVVRTIVTPAPLPPAPRPAPTITETRTERPKTIVEKERPSLGNPFKGVQDLREKMLAPFNNREAINERETIPRNYNYGGLSEDQSRHSPTYDIPERKTETIVVPRKKTPQEIAEEHAKYVAQYVNPHKREPGTRTVAIAIATEEGEFSRTIGTALEECFKSGQTKVLQSQFTPNFIADGLFKDAFGGSTSIFYKLDLAMSFDMVLLGRQTVEYETHPSLANTITARMGLELVAVPLGRRGQVQSWTFTANGPGFSEKQARSMAEERIMKQLKASTNLSLSLK